jgi:iron complex transport system substrate-binding protein
MTRIASLLAGGTEMLYGLGLGDAVVAVSHECDYPPNARTRPRVSGTRIAVDADSRQIDDQVRAALAEGQPLYQVDVERLIALRPDLIVTQSQCDVCAIRYDDVLALVRQTEALAGCAVVGLNPIRLADLYADIERLGRATSRESAAERYVVALQARVAAVAATVAAVPIERRPRVVSVEWIEPLMLAANWVPDLIEAAGGVPVVTRAGMHSGYTPIAELVACNPDCILVSPCGFDLRRTLAECGRLSQMPGWSELAAVRQRRVFAIDGSAYLNRCGPRLVDSIEIIARLLHPALFGWPIDHAGEPDIWQRLTGVGQAHRA